MKTIIIASKNPGKVAEYRAMLEPVGYAVTSLLDHPDFPEILETGTTFAENALLKAKAVSGRFHMPCLADDSGLEVRSLHNAPGVRSQRYSREGIPRTNNALLIRNLQGIQDRSARFVCHIVYWNENGEYRHFEGMVEGIILDEPRGTNGFGYDPHFYLPELQKTMAELPEAEKNRISHRGAALRSLLAAIAGDTL